MNRRRTIPSCIVTFLFLFFFLVAPSLFAELINDGSFENMPSDWSTVNNTPCPSIGNWSNVAGAPASFDGQQTLWVGGVCNNIPRNNGARQSISLQENAALLSFWFNPIKNTPDPLNIDRALVSVNGTEVWDLDVNGETNPTGWNNAVVDISQYADQTVSLSMEIRQNVDNSIANVFFDYVEIFHPAIEISQVIAPAGENSFDIEIFVENSGDTILDNLAVTNSSFVECNRAAGSLPDLEPGESTTYSCDVTSTATEVENTATVQATTTEIEYLVEASHTASVSNLNPLLTLTAEPETVTVSEGDDVSITLTLSNDGNSNLTGLHIGSAQTASCNFTLGSLAVAETAVFTCTFIPSQSGIIIFTATAVEPLSGREVSGERGVTIELLPIDPPTFPTFTQYIPVVANDFINHTPLGEPNDVCDQAYPLATNQVREFLAEDIHDWYKFTLDSSSNLTVNLTNFVPVAGQITIWRGTCQSLTYLGQNGDFATTKSISLTNQPAGTYHVWLINDGPQNSNDKYTLSVLVP